MDITDITNLQINGQIGSVKSSLLDEKTVEAAKSFEGVLIQQMLNTVQESLNDWGMEEDGADKQTQGLFWMYLGQEVSDKGGFGLWEDIYKSMSENFSNTETNNELPEINI